MADLGTLPEYPAQPSRPDPLLSVSNYKIHRGMELGEITTVINELVTPVLHHPLANYIIRQIRIIYRQLWPTHGQRFPQ
jgi:hypothetical protein